ncbi:hypothetical protein HC891_28170 [Candidatus Gracilibacteria bacterium]|nr:hypothetical protein [Candidatus Gracilibacteria bacterium]
MSNADECFETVAVTLQPGESSLDYGFVDADFIGAVDPDRPLAGRGPGERLKIGDASVATVIDDGQGGTSVVVVAPGWAWAIGRAAEWESYSAGTPVRRPKCTWKNELVDVTGDEGHPKAELVYMSVAYDCTSGGVH